MNENEFESNLKEILDRFSTHINRFNFLLFSFMNYGSIVNSNLVAYLRLDEGRKETFIKLLDNYHDDLEDLSEVITMIGQDLQDFGNDALKNNEHLLKMLENKQ